MLSLLSIKSKRPIFWNEICYDYVLYKFQHSRVQKSDFKNNNIIVDFFNLNQNHWAVIYADKVNSYAEQHEF
jgi:hypothetical protein